MIRPHADKTKISWSAPVSASGNLPVHAYEVILLGRTNSGDREIYRTTLSNHQTNVLLSTLPLNNLQRGEKPFVHVIAKDASNAVLSEGEVRLARQVRWQPAALTAAIIIASLIGIWVMVKVLNSNGFDLAKNPNLDKMLKEENKEVGEPRFKSNFPNDSDSEEPEIPVAQTTVKPVAASNRPKEGKPLYVGSLPKSQQVQQQGTPLAWYQTADPQWIKSILAKEDAYDPTVVRSINEDVIAPNEDIVYRYPAGWMVAINTETHCIESVFNMGTETNPTWIPTDTYTGGSVQGVRIRNISDQPVTVQFVLDRNRKG